MLQISSGLLRGVQLRSPKGPQTRPSSERLRQGTFNVLRHYRWEGEDSVLSNATIIDLFAGTGAWGIEALSNGATEAWFVESHPLALKALEENLDATVRSYEKQGFEAPKVELLRRDAAVAYRKLPAARVIFCDPPYEAGWFEKILRLEDEASRLTRSGLFLYEARDKENVPNDLKSLRHFDTKIYGDSSVHFFVKL